MEFLRKHVLGMTVFAVATGVIATFIYDYFEIRPTRTFFAKDSVSSSDPGASSIVAPAPLKSKAGALQDPTVPAFASTSLPLREWEDCVTRAEASVDKKTAGPTGARGAIGALCGERPIIEPDDVVGALPYDLVRSKTWAPKFRSVLGGSYDAFILRLTVSSETKQEGEWIVASGLMPHSGGTEEAAFAIHRRTGAVFAAVLEDGKHLTGYGFGNSWNAAPPYLKTWMAEKKR